MLTKPIDWTLLEERNLSLLKKANIYEIAWVVKRMQIKISRKITAENKKVTKKNLLNKMKLTGSWRFALPGKTLVLES